MNNHYILLKNKRDFVYVFSCVCDYGICLYLSKKYKKNFQKKFFPKGGLNPRTLDLKFTALTTRPKELTQEVDKNDGTKLYKRFVKNLSFLSQMSLIFKNFSKS